MSSEISARTGHGARTCFIMMPVSTPERIVDLYSGDSDHFLHILEHLIVPSVQRAGFQPLLPTVDGSLVIHSEIIRRLCVADMAIADMSSLNANVFFEMGIRTALNKPIAIIKDDKTKQVPFDTSIIKYHTYSSTVSAWETAKEIESLANHISSTIKDSDGKNGMWEAFNADRHLTTRSNSQNSSALNSIKKELEKIRRLQLLPSAHIPNQSLATITPVEVFSKLSDLAADAGYFIDIGSVSLHRIEVKMNKSKPIPKTMKAILEKAGGRFGYKILFAF